MSPHQISLDIPLDVPENQAPSTGEGLDSALSQPSQLNDDASVSFPSDRAPQSEPTQRPNVIQNVIQISLLDGLADPTLQAIAPEEPSPIPKPYLMPAGTIISSPGGHFSYRILGACCRLFDRSELPWPCCRIQWRSKEPSWRRIGKRFVPDLATKRFPSYMVEILDHEYSREPFVLTLYWLKFPKDIQAWWYTKYIPVSSKTTDT